MISLKKPFVIPLFVYLALSCIEWHTGGNKSSENRVKFIKESAMFVSSISLPTLAPYPGRWWAPLSVNVLVLSLESIQLIIWHRNCITQLQWQPLTCTVKQRDKYYSTEVHTLAQTLEFVLTGLFFYALSLKFVHISWKALLVCVRFRCLVQCVVLASVYEPFHVLVPLTATVCFLHYYFCPYSPWPVVCHRAAGVYAQLTCPA